MSPPRKLSDEQVAAIRADTRPHAEIAREFGISITHACNIRNGRKRGAVPGRGETRRDRWRFADLAWLAQAPIGSTVLLPIDDRRAANGSLSYWSRKTGARFRRHMTNHGLRVWRIA